MAARRHLPIMGQTSTPEAGPLPDEDAQRPPWQWVAVGAVLTFTMWLPLAMVAQWLSTQLVGVLLPSQAGASQASLAAELAQVEGGTRAKLLAATVLPQIVAFAGASAAAGSVVGRFGARAGAREAALGGLVAATVAWALTALSGGASALLLWPPVALVGALAGLAGGKLGLRKR